MGKNKRMEKLGRGTENSRLFNGKIRKNDKDSEVKPAIPEAYVHA
jgi:hypothetical protein